MTVPLGALYPITVEVRNAAGVLTSPSTKTLTITLPDLSTVTPTLTDTGGLLTYDYPTTAAGRHTWRVVTTGPVTAKAGAFNAAPADPGWILDLRDAKRHLNMAATVTTDDDELGDMMSVVTEVVEQIVGPVAARVYTERVRSGTTALLLTHYPVVSVTSVTSVSGSPTWTTGFDVDAAAGIVRLSAGGYFTGGPWNATYVAGRTVIPARFVQAGKEMLRHLWETQRGSSAGSAYRPSLGEDQVFSSAAGMTYSIPKRVVELLQYDQVPGIA